jgi:hypothetical protein
MPSCQDKGGSMGYVIRDQRHEIDGATLIKLIQRAKDRDEKRKWLLKGQCVEDGNNRKLTWWERLRRMWG